MKILIISDAWHPQINGVVRTYEHITAEFEKMGHDVKIIGPADFPYKTGLPSYSEIKLVLFPYRRLEKMVKAYDPDMIHVAVEGPLGWAGRKYCKKHKQPFSTSYHTHFPLYMEERLPHKLHKLRKWAYKLGRWYVKAFHSPSTAIMVASPSLENILQNWGFKNQISHMTRGVDTAIFYPDPGVNLFPDLKKPVALYVGRVAVEKNLEEFLKMDWQGSKLIVGDGPSRKYLEKKYPDAVFVGKKSGTELADHYRSADLFVFPSKTDTFGIVILEALASGIPVAAYPVTGPIDILNESDLGALDENLSLAAQKALRAGNPQKKIAFVKEHYSWHLAACQFIEALQDAERDCEPLNK